MGEGRLGLGQKIYTPGYQEVADRDGRMSEDQGGCPAFGSAKLDQASTSEQRHH